MASEKRQIDADLENADNCETAKIKTHFAKIIVEGTAKHPYYGILFFNPTDGEYHVGFGSYYIGNVFQWLSEEFEIVDAPTVDAVEVVRCKDCKWFKKGTPFRHECNNICAGMFYVSQEDFCSYGERKDNG